MRIISMYLPQFHETKENNEWWGKGYTDWNAVRLGEPLFEGHNQPRVPYENNYYDLRQKEVMEWQSSLMKKYGIYGQCFYHYWFGNGKNLLCKPAENLLKWKDIDMHFCFSWANETWVRSWSNIVEANVWAPKFENNSKSSDVKGILVEQFYGGEIEWKDHFEYLLPFFTDSRYIRKDNKPIFMFFRPDHIPCLNEMIICWQKWAREAGLEGIHFIGANTENKRNMDALYLHATGSMFPSVYYKEQNSVKCISYETVWNEILFQASAVPEETYVGGLVDFDTTPRKGKSGVVIQDCNVECYRDSMKKLLAYNERNGVEFTFLNAWNEWGEGMYLEPDTKQGHAFLEATLEASLTYGQGKLPELMDYNEHINFLNNKITQYKTYWRLMDKWMRKKENNISLGSIIQRKGYSHIAIYGYGILGEHLIKELEKTEVVIDYLIDTRKTTNNYEFRMVNLDGELPETNLIVVSVINEYDTIYQRLAQMTDIPIVSLEEIVFEEE